MNDSGQAELYGDEFYKDRDTETKLSAKIILNIINEIFKVDSAVDLGCGVGTWLKTMQDITGGCKVLGMDGEYVNQDYLVIKPNEFMAVDLEKKIIISERFDLAISLEVAEHLSEKRAEGFVRDITALSDVVLFSAAFPKQGGVEHINEQKISYWISLFDKCGYEKFDIIRPLIYDNYSIPFWYRNNTMLYVNRNSDKINESLLSKQQFPVSDIILFDVFKMYYESLEESVKMKSLKFQIKELFKKLGWPVKERIDKI